MRGAMLRIKFPKLVSYNKFPWTILSMDSPDVHKHVARHYAKVLTLAAINTVPNLLQDFHPEVPEHKWPSLLPSLLYVLPRVDSELQDPMEYGPFGWQPQRVTDTTALQHYGILSASVGRLKHVIMYKSPDLRLLCNAVTIQAGSKQLTVIAGSTLSQLFTTSSATTSTQSSSSNKKQEHHSSRSVVIDEPMPDFTIFHFFRPNRPPAELSRPFIKYYTTHCSSTVQELETYEQPTSWTPVLEAPPRSKGIRATHPKFKPPTSYLLGLPERHAIIPGDCFGSRALMWGYYF